MEKRYLVTLIIALISSLSLFSCQEAASDKTIRQEKVGDAYLYLGEEYGGSRYKPMYIFDCRTEDQYEDKNMTLNDTWFSMRADATYVRSGYYSPYNNTYDYAKVTYNISRNIIPNDKYWRGGAFYTTNIENIIAITNDIYCIKHCNYSGYERQGLDFYEVKADFYKQLMSIINGIVSQEPIQKGKNH